MPKASALEEWTAGGLAHQGPHPPCAGLSTGPLFLPKGHLCCQGQNTPRAMPGPSASSRNCAQGGCSDSRRVQPGPITSGSSRPLRSPPNALMPSLEPERADPTAWTAEGRAEGRAGDWPVPQKGVALLPFSPAARHIDIRTVWPGGWESHRASIPSLGSGCFLSAVLPSHFYLTITNLSQGFLKRSRPG